MKTGIIGAGRIGKFHAREFLGCGCEVVAILEKEEDKLKEVIKNFLEDFKIKVNVHSDLEKFLEEKMDIVSVCTPAEIHAHHIRESLKKGFNVFSEKPLVFDNENKNSKIVTELIELANKKDKIISVNTQWACLFDYPLNFPKKINEFKMYMEPGVTGIGMLKEHLAHMNSILIKLLPEGKSDRINFLKKADEEMGLEFYYSNEENKCRVEYLLSHKKEGVRKMWFEINGKKYERLVEKDYSQKIVFGDSKIQIEDPFKTSIRKFVEAVRNNDKTRLLVSEKEILENIKLQDEIIGEYLKLQ